MSADNHQVTGSESLWFMDRCGFCFGEVKSTEIIWHDGKKYCSQRCVEEDAKPETTA